MLLATCASLYKENDQKWEASCPFKLILLTELNLQRIHISWDKTEHNLQIYGCDLHWLQ